MPEGGGGPESGPEEREEEAREGEESGAGGTEEGEELRSAYLRALAEQRNMAERHRRQLEEERRFAPRALALELLDVADNLDRALAGDGNGPVAQETSAEGAGAQAEGSEAARLREGVALVARHLEEALARHGVVRFEALGEPLDPHRHEAMAEVEGGEHAPGHVAAVVQSGWLIHGRLLRPARVLVAKKAAP